MYGSKISVIRLSRGFTQEYVAKKIGIEQTVYSKIENDARAKITDDLLRKIAITLGVTIEDITSPTPVIMSFQNNIHGSIQGNYNNELYEKSTSILLKLLDSLQIQIANQNKLLELLLHKQKDEV